MKILSKMGNDAVATVYIADFGDNRIIEFVESVQPPIPREKKWVLIVSTLFGCPVRCRMCDAGGDYRGKLSAGQMFDQIDYLIRRRFADGRVPVEKFKIQFARMGEPAFNDDVLEVLEQLPQRYEADGLMPSVSTIAPKGTAKFFGRLAEIKQNLYGGGSFQLQFSLHSSDEQARDWLMPVTKWGLAEISAYGEKFFGPGDRKITLNFALGKGAPLAAAVLRKYFDPGKFIIKVTPINPTFSTVENKLQSYIEPDEYRQEQDEKLGELRECGYEVIVSIGELEENKIGSNCGQYVNRYLQARQSIAGGYSYTPQRAQEQNGKRVRGQEGVVFAKTGNYRVEY